MNNIVFPPSSGGGSTATKVEQSITSGLTTSLIRNDASWLYSNTGGAGALQLELLGLFGSATNMNGTMDIVITQTDLPVIKLTISGKYASASGTWTVGDALLYSNTLTPLNIRFCRSASSVFVLIGDTTSNWVANTRVEIRNITTNSTTTLSSVAWTLASSYPANIDQISTVIPPMYSTAMGNSILTLNGVI